MRLRLAHEAAACTNASSSWARRAVRSSGLRFAAA